MTTSAIPADAQEATEQPLVTRLRNADVCSDDDIELAADMLEFFLGQMQMHSPKMNGQHSYRFRHGWPMTHAVGSSAEEAIQAAIAEEQRDVKYGTNQNPKSPS